MLIVEDEPYMAEAIREGLRLEAIPSDVANDGASALELLSSNAYDIAVLDRDIPGPSGDEIARRIVASGSGMPILMLTAADRLDDKTTGFELGERRDAGIPLDHRRHDAEARRQLPEQGGLVLLAPVDRDPRRRDGGGGRGRRRSRPIARGSRWFAADHASSQDSPELPARMRFSICRRYAPAA